MKIRRVLVVYRKSLYQIYVKEHREQAIKQALNSKDTVALGLHQAHLDQVAALTRVTKTLKKLKIEAVIRWRTQMRPTQKYDLVISLGGDGTLLDTSRRILDGTPLMGINSDPSRSIGALCSGTTEDLPTLLEALGRGEIVPEKVNRLRLRVDGQEIVGPTLNDVLLAHLCPAGLTRFDMAQVPMDQAHQAHSGHQGTVFTHHRCSGIWISSAIGSTGAIHSAGGRIMSARSRRIQYLVREPYMLPTSNLPHSKIKGFVQPGQALVLISRMRRGGVWADGVHRYQALAYSQQVIIDQHPIPLNLIRLS